MRRPSLRYHALAVAWRHGDPGRKARVQEFLVDDRTIELFGEASTDCNPLTSRRYVRDAVRRPHRARHDHGGVQLGDDRQRAARTRLGLSRRRSSSARPSPGTSCGRGRGARLRRGRRGARLTRAFVGDTLVVDGEAKSAPPPDAARRRRRARAARRSRTGFARFTFVLVLAMYLNVASGAFVRLSGSGLGCPDWPLCHGGPCRRAQYHAVIEFSNRAIALGGILAALLTWWVSRSLADRVGRWLCGGVAIGTLFQIPLGAITVLTDLQPVLRDEPLPARDHGARARERRLGARHAAATTASSPAAGSRCWRSARPCSGSALIVTGAFSTAAGPALGRRRHPPRRQPARHDVRARARRDRLRDRGRRAAPAAAAPRARPDRSVSSRSRCSSCCRCRRRSASTSGTTSCRGASCSRTSQWPGGRGSRSSSSPPASSRPRAR